MQLQVLSVTILVFLVSPLLAVWVCHWVYFAFRIRLSCLTFPEAFGFFFPDLLALVTHYHP